VNFREKSLSQKKMYKW